MFSFRLTDDFVAGYKDVRPPFGYRDAGGNSVGEITFLRTYSRLKSDGSGKETWPEVCRRVIEGMYSIQKDHCKTNRLPWNNSKAQASAQDAYDRLFNLKWTPPGRGLWVMGTPIVNVQRNSAALQNCAFVSTKEMTKQNPSRPFAFLQEASMLGVGVGFDTEGVKKDFEIYAPSGDVRDYVIPDTREGWMESTCAIIDAYLKPGQSPINFDYSEIRPLGAPISTFGGTAAGPDPLIRLHESIRGIFDGRAGQLVTTVDIADIGNLIGVCTVSGNVRRSAELLMGSIDDEEFLNLKNAEAFPSRNSYDAATPGWAYMSNNSVSVTVGTDLERIVPGIALNGEPGVIWMDITRKYGRLADPINNKDHRAAGYNPCAEQSLESFECCTLTETYLNNHDSLEDYKKTLKVAYLYGKTVTLLPTHWEDTNAIMQRNRRIGLSMSGIANFADTKGLPALRQWMDEGYETVQRYDTVYSEWLCVRESIKTTTVKPSGTVSILAGESPGVHWTPGGKYFLRAIRFANDDAMLPLFRMAGYRVEPASENPDYTSVVFFPIKSKAERAERDVTIFEKMSLAATAQRYWSDNSVSVTVSFDPETEADHVGTVLHMYDGQLKTVSFLPSGNFTYKQMPYTQITEKEYEEATLSLLPVPLEPVYEGMTADAIGEAFCSTDACIMKVETSDIKQ
jgi:adenosylcobalamin-dependent ribonucleoside-triphosphate reductase